MNDEALIYVLTAIYAICNFARLAAYVPQIAAVARDRTGAFGTSLISWTLWAFTYAVTAVYCGVVAQDALLATMMGGNTIGASLIAILTLLKRREFLSREFDGVRS